MYGMGLFGVLPGALNVTHPSKQSLHRFKNAGQFLVCLLQRSQAVAKFSESPGFPPGPGSEAHDSGRERGGRYFECGLERLFVCFFI